MFKTAATKIAHNSTIPALGGNQDLRPLQDLITAEKAVLISLQKLSVDYSKASEALRAWGLTEGDDLGDILSASTSILNHFSSALSQYATHGHSMRDQLKAIRTREELLDDLRRRRRNVHKKAEDAEKKLIKMSPEHKNLVMQTDILNRLREDIRTMDSDIMSEEAALGDFKRTATKMWMGLKFGGLLECCEKGTIAGEYGKLTIGEISEEITQPGCPRSFYYGHSKVEGIVAEAHRCVNEVALSTVPSVGFRDRHQYDQRSPNQAPDAHSPQTGYGEPPNSGTWFSGNVKLQPLPPQDDTFQTPIRPFTGNNHFRERSNSSSPSLTTSLGNQPHAPPYQPQLSQGSSYSQTMPSSQQLGVNEGTTDDFGVNTRSTGSVDPAGGRFATFPVKTRPPGSSGGYSLQDPPLLGGRNPASDSSFSASIAEALHEKEGLKAVAESPWGDPFNGGSKLSVNSEGTTRATEGSYSQSTNSWGGRSDGDPPPFDEVPPATTPSFQFPTDSKKRSSGPLPPPQPSAGSPKLANPWLDASHQAPGHSRQPSHLSENDDALLAYMTTADGDSVRQESPPNTAVPISVPPATTTTTTVSAPAAHEEDPNLSRHVRFGSVEDVDEEMEKRVSLEKERANTRATGTSPSLVSQRQHLTTTTPDEGPGDNLGKGEMNRTANNNDQAKPASRRVPPPAIGPTEEDEKTLNAAAAREVGLELEALKNNELPPVPSQVDQRSQPDPTTDFDRGRPMTASTPRFNDYHPGPPAVLPTAAGARDESPRAPSLSGRNLPPHPYAELNPPGTYSPYSTPPQPYAQQPYQPPAVSPAQAYAQSYQQQQQSPASSPYVPYAQPPAPDMRNTLPPRFQALNNNNMTTEPQVPPRFQGSSSPVLNSLPPRFQTNYTSQVSSPGGVSIPDQQQQRDEALPPVYPRPIASTSPYTRSNSSLTSLPLQASRGATPPNTGVRTINAAAFKRPTPRNTGSVDTEGKKLLPISPYPDASSSSPVQRNEMSGQSQQQSQQQRHRKQPSEVEDGYDYISAYVNNSGPPSPQEVERLR